MQFLAKSTGVDLRKHQKGDTYIYIYIFRIAVNPVKRNSGKSYVVDNSHLVEWLIEKGSRNGFAITGGQLR